MRTAGAETFEPAVAQDLVWNVGRGRLPEVDGLRGIAILSVMASHYLFTLTGEGHGLLNSFHPFVAMGWAGVDLFFVLSGFLIGGILFDSRTSPRYFRTFYVRRFYRIIPLYYAWILGYVLLLAVGEATHLASGKPDARLPLYSYFLFLQNFKVFHVSGIGAAWFGATWSLAVEEQFYLIVPLVIWWLPTRKLAVFLACAIVSAPVLRFVIHNSGESGPALANILMPCRMDAFAMGIIVAILLRDRDIRTYLMDQKAVLPVFLATSFAGFVAVSVGWYSRPWSLGMQTIGLTGIASFFAATLFFVLANPNSIVSSILRIKWLRSIGMVSYCMYLCHLGVWGTLHDLLLPPSWGESGWLGVGVAVIAALFTYAVAKISWACLERPLISEGRSYRY